MSVLTHAFDPAISAVFQVEMSYASASPHARTEKRHRIRLLVDTGADLTCITTELATELELQPIAKIALRSVSHEFTSQQYLVDIHVPTEDGFIHLPNMRIVEYPIGGDPHHDGLLGRDILQHCLVQLNGPAGTFTLAF